MRANDMEIVGGSVDDEVRPNDGNKDILQEVSWRKIWKARVLSSSY